MKTYFNRYPWLVYAIVGIILVPLCAFVSYKIWYKYLDTTPRPGEVYGVHWQLEVKEYHLQAVYHEDWIADLPSEYDDLECAKTERIVDEKQPDGSTRKVEILDNYCSYYVDEWELYKTYPTSGTDYSPYYASHGPNTSTVKFEESIGLYKVFFKSEYAEKFWFYYDFDTWKNFQKDMKVTIEVNRNGTVPYRPELPR